MGMPGCQAPCAELVRTAAVGVSWDAPDRGPHTGPLKTADVDSHTVLGPGVQSQGVSRAASGEGPCQASAASGGSPPSPASRGSGHITPVLASAVPWPSPCVHTHVSPSLRARWAWVRAHPTPAPRYLSSVASASAQFPNTVTVLGTWGQHVSLCL